MSICNWCREYVRKPMARKLCVQGLRPREDLLKALEDLRRETVAERKKRTAEMERLQEEARLIAAFNERGPDRIQELQRLAECAELEASGLQKQIWLFRDEAKALAILADQFGESTLLLQECLDGTYEREDALKPKISQALETLRLMQERISSIEEAIKYLRDTEPCSQLPRALP